MSTRRDIDGYSVYVFDLDGTLYDQRVLRAMMALRLVSYYVRHPFSAGDLIVLQHFRKVKDRWSGSSSEEDIIAAVAADKKTGTDRVRGIVKKWIYDAPLDVLPKTRDKKLIEWIDELRMSGKKVVILSDYPTSDKLRSLGVNADAQYSPDDDRIVEMKPSPVGLNVVMQDMSVAAEEILMIGDRYEKDGKAAEAAGVDFIILERNVKKRDHNEFKV